MLFVKKINLDDENFEEKLRIEIDTLKNQEQTKNDNKEISGKLNAFRIIYKRCLEEKGYIVST